MTFWQKVKAKLANFMQGRHGADNLGMVTLVAGLVLSLLGSFTGSSLLSILGMLLYIITIYRMFSRNNEKRAEENRKYITLMEQLKTRFKQLKIRIKNRKVYKYFHCPKCHALLRLSRGCGQKHVTCGRCKHEFDQKA